MFLVFRLAALLAALALLSGAPALAETAVTDLKVVLAGQAVAASGAAGGGAACGIRNSPFVVLRAEAKLESAAVATLGPEDRLTLVGRRGDWVQVTTAKGTGWMRAHYLSEPAGGTQPAPVPLTAAADAGAAAVAATAVSAPPAPAAPNPATGAGPSAVPATPVVTPSTPAAPVDPVKSRAIAGQRILLIGDSHSVGTYGSELDSLLRKAGAKVRSVGVSGSSPSWWWNGTVTKCGFIDRRADGTKDAPADWRTPRATPSFAKLLDDHRPDLVVISLGANMLGAAKSKIVSDCGKLVDMARDAGARVIWVGPPDARAASTDAARASFYATIGSVFAGRVTAVVDARKFTRYPASGGDGVHYWGAEGTKQAKAWARAVFDAIGD